jgi:pSer/pThr/pTyr-binding forkhead associated (FHA) protein
MEARFTVISGPFRGQTFQVPSGKFILGRETDCLLVIDSNSVSRHHCVLLLDDYTLRIRDLASKNGTFVNRDQARVGERILVHGDTVRVGDMVIRVELESASGSPEAAYDRTLFSPAKCLLKLPSCGLPPTSWRLCANGSC